VNSNERALRAVRTQVQFEVAEMAARVASAAMHTARKQRQENVLTLRCESIANEVRTGLSRPSTNPALIEAMQRLYHDDCRRLQQAQALLAVAQEREQQVRTGLAGVRNRERSLERAMNAERRKERLKQQALEVSRADDLWLQHAGRQLS
jgi:hypothetical protein